MKKFGVIACSVWIAGCLPMGNFEITETGSAASFSTPTIVAGNCGAEGFQSLLNNNESALAGLELPEGTRIIRPGSVYTRDADGTRLNIGINGSGTIVHVACG